MKRISVENLTIFTGRLLANGQVAHPTRLPGTLDAMQERSGFRLANVAIPWLLYLAGFLVFFRWQLWSSFNLVFGDRGDTRLICFIHEHVYHWLTGGAALLSPPFFFNWTKTLGYSDAFLLDQAIYAPLRLMGVEPYLALSLVAFILSPAAYFFTYLLLRRLHLSVPMAALAALIFTFANNQYLKSVHLQHFAIYYLPIVAYCAVRAVDELHRRPLVSCLLGAFAAGLFGAVFSTGYYMAWFFALALLISTPIAAYIARKEVAAWWRAGPRLALALALVAVGGFAASLSIFFVIYAPALATGAMRTFQDYMFYAPRPYDLINVGRENMVWSGLIRSLHLVRADHLANTERSIAMTPVLQALVVAALLVSLRPGFWPANPAGRMSQAFAVAGAGVCLAFPLLIISVGDYSLFRIFYAVLPGTSAIRAGFRGMIVANLFAIISVGLTFDRLIRLSLEKPRTALRVTASVALVALMGFAAIEQVNLAQVATLSRAFEREHMSGIHAPPRNCSVFYAAHEAGRSPEEVQLDAMLIAQMHQIPTINGYSGVGPPGWDLAYTMSPDYERRAKEWAARRGIADGLCRLDVERKAWTPVAVDTPTRFEEVRPLTARRYRWKRIQQKL